jgi:hypothetical protein
MGLDQALICDTNYSMLEALQCGICSEIAFPPVRTFCHIFCKHCIKSWLLEENTCPVDKIYDPQPRNDHFAMRLILSIPTRCRNCTLGCSVVGPFGEMYKYHPKECLYEIVYCTNPGCDVKCERRELKKHKKECDFRKKRCKHCLQKIRAIDEKVKYIMVIKCVKGSFGRVYWI